MSKVHAANKKKFLFEYNGRGVTAGSLILPGITTAFSIGGRINEGDGVVPAVVKGVGESVVFDTMFNMLSKPAQGLSFGLMVAGAVGGVAVSLGEKNAGNLSSTLSGDGMYNKTQIHTKNAVSMRQRGMSMINDNGEVVRSAFGSEARAYYRSL